MSYHELSVAERATIQIGLLNKFSQRRIARLLNRSPSTISREIRRNRTAHGHYVTHEAQQSMSARRQACRRYRKLVPGNQLFELVAYLLRKRFSPEQIAGKLRSMEFPQFEDAYVCRETIYNAIIKGKANASAVGTLVERASGYLMLVKMNDATATSAVEGFSAALNRLPLAVRKSMTYDQGREMVRHAQITQKTGVAIYFCDPHSPWQRGSNENINGLIRQYLPKGTDLSIYSQEQLDAIAYELNIRPRKRFDFKCPIEVMTEVMAKQHEVPASIQ